MQLYLLELRDMDFAILEAEPGKDLKALRTEYHKAKRTSRKTFENFVNWLCKNHGFKEVEVVHYSF